MQTSPSQKKTTLHNIRSFWRRHPDLNWGMKLLQSFALPLGYSAISVILERGSQLFAKQLPASLEIYCTPQKSRSRKLSFLERGSQLFAKQLPASLETYCTPQKSRSRKLSFLERETRFELATFALARQRSTTEPLPHLPL